MRTPQVNGKDFRILKSGKLVNFNSAKSNVYADYDIQQRVISIGYKDRFTPQVSF